MNNDANVRCLLIMIQLKQIKQSLNDNSVESLKNL